MDDSSCLVGFNRGVEYIGYNPDSGTLTSHYFGTSGEVLEYTYNLADQTLTIWYGGKDSPAKFVGTIQRGRHHQHRRVALARRRLRIHHDPD